MIVLKYFALAVITIIVLMCGAFLVGQVALNLAAAPPYANGQPGAHVLGDEDIAVVVTRDEGGEERRTQVWIVGERGHVFLRSMQGARWSANLRRDPATDVWVDDYAYRMNAEFIADAELEHAVNQNFFNKYPRRSAMFRLFGVEARKVIQLLPQ